MNKRRFYTKRMLMLSLLTCTCCLPGQAKANDVAAASTERNSIENILQTRKISGIVKDSQGPITGANVSIKGTTIGAITDIMVNLVLMHLKKEFSSFHSSDILHKKYL